MTIVVLNTNILLRGVPWERLKALEGVVSIGGNAVEDCKALYDDS